LPPAAARTINDFLSDTHTNADDYDMIVTGDLGLTGTELLHELLEIEYSLDIRRVHNDCGLMIFDLKKQDVNSGGSGCGCSASVLCSHLIKRMKSRELSRILFLATGALMSPTSTKQGQPIPGIAHAVLLERNA
jgi:stage V sporulation protein AD